MRKVNLAALMQRTEAVAVASYLEASPELAAGAGAAVARFGGITCLGVRRVDEPFLNRALGFGTTADATPSLLDRIERHYASIGRPPRITEAVGHTPRAAIRLLVRRGYRRVEGSDEMIYGYLRRKRPAIPDVTGMTVERAGPDDADRYAAVAYESFKERGPVFKDIVAALLRDVRRRRSLFAYLARIDGEPAATGMLFDVRPVAGLGNGSVLPKFRGRGIQTAMIAYRMRIGWDRGRRYFFGQTQNPVSAHNMEELGWRLLYTEVNWVRSAR
jgi:GNAT superfamily N-acetyltransferase